LVNARNLATSNAKSDLLRHVSHTLREPLAAIVLAAQALGAEKPLGLEARDNIRIILRNAEIQAHNVEELMLAAELFAKGGEKPADKPAQK